MIFLAKSRMGLACATALGFGFSVATSAAAGFVGYDETKLISDGSVHAAKTDKNLVNPWGISHGPGGPFWVSDNGTGLTTLYDGLGAISQLVVAVPGPGGATGSPTGQVFNGTPGFVVSETTPGGTKSAPALFIFVNEDGVVSGWAPNVDLLNAIPMATAADPGLANAVYKGATLATYRGQEYLFATDFHNGRVTVFDSNWNNVSAKFPFQDPKIPATFAPFNIAQIGNYLIVTYALQDSDKHDDVRGSGHGFIDVYGLNGQLHRRFATYGHLNSPWGLALAPKGFGDASGRLLVGNFGDGAIAKFNLGSGAFEGYLTDINGNPLKIPSLWALTFGEGVKNVQPNTLYFTAGLKDEGGGLFGTLTPHQ